MIIWRYIKDVWLTAVDFYWYWIIKGEYHAH